MKILFFYPEHESLGIGYISSLLKQEGHSVELSLDPLLFSDREVNLKLLAKKFDFKKKIMRKLLSYKPDLIAFSVVTDNYKWACDIAKMIREKTKIPIVFGGIHPTSVPDRVIKNKFVDFIVVGEGEYAMLDLVNRLKEGAKDFDINNVWYKKGEQVVKNPVRPLIRDLDSLPFPDKDIFYSKAPYLKGMYSIATGRGCPHRCSYCCNNFLRRIYSNKGVYVRKRSVNNVIKELEIAKKRYNPQIIWFHDDNFIQGKERFKEFMREYKERIGLPFKCMVNPNYLDKDIISTLKKGGCIWAQIGVQSVNEEIRRNVCYRLETNNKIKDVTKLMEKQGIHVFIDHIFGLPGEKFENYIEAAKFYNLIRPTQINKFWLKYYPKTDIINISLKEGLLKKEHLEKIENAEFGKDYLKGGSVKDYKNLMKFQALFSIIPLLPAKLVNFIIDKNIYRFFPSHYIFTVITPQLIRTIFYKELRDGFKRALRKYYFFLRNYNNI